MKKLSWIIAMVLCPLMAHAGGEQFVNKDNYHFGYVSVAGGYTSLSQNVRNVNTTGSWGALGGVGYEFRKSNVWVSAGLQFMQLQSQTQVGQYDFIPGFQGLDDQNKSVEYYRYTIRQTDHQLWREIDIPVMVGYFNSGFYVGAGAKAGFSVGSTITTEADYDLSAQYTQYVGEFKDVNYYKHYPLPSLQYDCPLRPQFSVIAEIGYDVLSSVMSNSKVCHVLNVGLYAEYGLRSVRPADSQDPISLQGMNMEEAAQRGTDVRDATVNPYYLSTQTQGQRVVPYFVGLKLTYLIGGSRHSGGTWHRGCQCYGK